MVTGTLGTWCRAPGYVLKCSPEETGFVLVPNETGLSGDCAPENQMLWRS